MKPINDHVKIIELLDFYGVLLPPSQAERMRHYYYDNYTLSELAQMYQVSRTAVHDQIQRGTQKLYDYENKLALHAKAKTRQELMNELRNASRDETIIALIDALEKVE